MMDVFVSYIQRLYFHPGFSSVLVHVHFHLYKSGGLSALSEKHILSFCGHGKRKFSTMKS